METKDKAVAMDLNDIIFENRNRDYGAYLLRKIYSKHINLAFIIAVSLFTFFLLLPLIIELLTPVQKVEKIVRVIEYTQLDAPPPIDKNQPPPPPPLELPPPLKSSIKFLPPVIKKDELVQEDEVPPTVEELKDVNPGDKTVKGSEEGFDEGIFDTVATGNKVVDEAPVEEVFTIVEQMPEFPNGLEAMYKYLSTNIKYPPMCKEAGISGKVYLSFIINKEGKISDVTVLKGLGCLDEEAVRVVKNMPPWKPGKMNGRPVIVKYTIPIKFTLE